MKKSMTTDSIRFALDSFNFHIIFSSFSVVVVVVWFFFLFVHLIYSREIIFLFSIFLSFILGLFNSPFISFIIHFWFLQLNTLKRKKIVNTNKLYKTSLPEVFAKKMKTNRYRSFSDFRNLTHKLLKNGPQFM